MNWIICWAKVRWKLISMWKKDIVMVQYFRSWASNSGRQAELGSKCHFNWPAKQYQMTLGTSPLLPLCVSVWHTWLRKELQVKYIDRKTLKPNSLFYTVLVNVHNHKINLYWIISPASACVSDLSCRRQTDGPVVWQRNSLCSASSKTTWFSSQRRAGCRRDADTVLRVMVHDDGCMSQVRGPGRRRHWPTTGTGYAEPLRRCRDVRRHSWLATTGSDLAGSLGPLVELGWKPGLSGVVGSWWWTTGSKQSKTIGKQHNNKDIEFLKHH